MESDPLRQALRRLRAACAEVQAAIDAVLDAPSPPPPAPSAPPLDRLHDLHGPLVAAGVEPADAAFAARARERHAELPEDRRGSLLSECARLLDGLLWKYHLLLAPELRARTSAVARALTGADPVAEEVQVPSAEPAGTLVAEISPFRKLVSAGRTGPAPESFLETARRAARTPSPARPAALDSLMKLWPQFVGADGAKELTLLRYAANAVQPVDPALADPLARLLGQRGVAETRVQVGGLFDDSYPPSRFERRRLRSAEPRNTILSVLQRGFVGPDGVALQPAVVAVSDGEGSR
jgi:hypothetical protein